MRSTLPKITLFLAVSFMIISACQNKKLQPVSSEITVSDLITHINFLADDALEGRGSGSAGEAKASNYIADYFEAFGLKKAGENGTWYQEFEVTLGVSENVPTTISVEGVKLTEEGTMAWPTSSSKTVTAPTVFAGYGIIAEDLNYNDFQSINLDGKIALVLRNGPDGDNDLQSKWSTHWDINKKIAHAIDNGAVGVIVGVAPGQDEIELSLKSDQQRSGKSIPIAQIDQAATLVLADMLKIDISQRAKKIEKEEKPASVESDKMVTVTVNLSKDVRIARNVIAFKDNPGNKSIVIGAHYDHLGWGQSGSLYRGDEPKIHNGADDNASGTSGLLELAHYFSLGVELEDDLLFIAISGEELGLIGSNYFVNHPTIDIGTVKAMINMDMIGRMTDNKLTVFGTGSANMWDSVITRTNSDNLELQLVPDGTGASDHTSFYYKNIPVLHYFTGTHTDYHKPSDDASYINAIGMRTVVSNIASVIKELDRLNEETFYFTEAPVTQKRTRRTGKVTLGVIPDFSYQGGGMKITGVNKDQPAEIAGMKGGDIIIAIDGKKVADIYEYMDALSGFKKGDKARISVKRGDKEITLNVQF